MQRFSYMKSVRIPVCYNYKSQSGCAFGDRCRFGHLGDDVQPGRVSKKSDARRFSCFIEGVYAIGLCTSRSLSEKIYSDVKRGNWDQITPSNSPKDTWHHIKIRERKNPTRGVIQKCGPHELNPCAPKFEERAQDETLQQEKMCPQRSTGLGESLQLGNY